MLLRIKAYPFIVGVYINL